MKNILLFLFLISIGIATYAQKPSDYGIKSKKALEYYLGGSQQMNFRDYVKAIEEFTLALELEPGFTEAAYQLGTCYFLKQKYEKALPVFEKVVIAKNPEYWQADFYLAECYARNAQYKEAIPLYEKFLKATLSHPSKYSSQAATSLRKCKFAASAIKSPVQFEPFNMGAEVNSEGDDVLPVLTADDKYLFFTTRRPGCTGGFDASLNDFPEDFYSCEWSNNKWTEAVNIGPPVNTDLNEGAACFTQDGNFVFFTGCNREDGFGNCDLYIARFDGKKWNKAENLGKTINSQYWDSQPWLSYDNKRLYFSSSRPSGLGGTDIWYSDWSGSSWSAPVNLGKPVNSPGNEYSPFLHSDGLTLYFSSDFHDGFGSTDLFYSRLGNDIWSDPVNLGYPLNSPGKENNIYINASGDKAFYNSSKAGGFGRNDLYSFTLDPKIRPLKAIFVRGTVTDSTTGKPVAAEVRFIELSTGDTVRNVRTDAQKGRFLLTLPSKRSYTAYVDQKGYLFASRNFTITDADSGKDVEIKLQPIKIGASIVLKNLFFETAKYDIDPTSFVELDELVKFLVQNASIKVELGGHTDNVGTAEYNRKLSASRAASVKTYLEQKGIKAERISANGYGPDKPVASNDTEEGRALNRRTEVTITGFD